MCDAPLLCFVLIATCLTGLLMFCSFVAGATPGNAPPASPVKSARVPSANPLLRQGAPEVKSMGAELQQGSPDSPRKLVSVRGVARTLKSPTAAGQAASPAAAAGPVDALSAANPLKARMAAASAASASRVGANPLLTAGGLLPAKEGDMNSNPLFANKIKAAAAPAPPGTASLLIARSSAVGKMTGMKGKSRIKKAPDAASGAAKEDDA